jgi:hypothetical protein
VHAYLPRYIVQYSTVAEQFEDYVKGIALKKRKEKKVTIRK